MKTLRALFVVSMSLLGLGLGLQLPGCGWGDEGYLNLPCPPDAGPELAPYCAPPDGGQGGAGGAGGGGGAGGMAFCPGPCVPKAPEGWSLPEPHWIGDSAQVPSDCAAVGGTPLLRYANPISAPLVCGQCGCGVPTAVCPASPLENWLSSDLDCNPNAMKTDIAVPADWDGSCTNENAIPKDLDCNGVPCARSLYTGKLPSPEETCEGLLSGAEPKPPVTWDIGVLKCQQPSLARDIHAVCGDGVAICGYHLPPSYRYCVTHSGDVECPADSPYTAKRAVVVSAKNVIDDRSCVCECGITTTGLCSAEFHVYAGPNCTDELFFDQISSAPLMDQCDNLMTAGTPIGSRSMEKIAYVPGVCGVSKEGTTGSVRIDEDRAATVCCRDEP